VFRRPPTSMLRQQRARCVCATKTEDGPDGFPEQRNPTIPGGMLELQGRFYEGQAPSTARGAEDESALVQFGSASTSGPASPRTESWFLAVPLRPSPPGCRSPFRTGFGRKNVAEFNASKREASKGNPLEETSRPGRVDFRQGGEFLSVYPDPGGGWTRGGGLCALRHNKDGLGRLLS